MGGTPTILWPNGTATRPNLSAEGHFGWRNSTAPGASSYHRGQDFWGIGSVRAIAAGEVVFVGWGSAVGWGGGYQVWIQHDGFFTRSLHMVDGSSPVKKGQRVAPGTVIGTEGMTGAYQVHLHLEVTPGHWHTANTGQVDPVAFIEARIEEDELSAEAEEKIDKILEIAKHMAFGKDGRWEDGDGGRVLRILRDRSGNADDILKRLDVTVDQLSDLIPGRPGQYPDHDGFKVIRAARNAAQRAEAKADASSAAVEALSKIIAQQNGVPDKDILARVEKATREGVDKALKNLELTLSVDGDS